MLPSFSGFIQPLSVAILGCQPPFPFSSFSHRFLFRPSTTLKHNDLKRTLTNADINHFVSPPSSSGPSHINSGWRDKRCTLSLSRMRYDDLRHAEDTDTWL